MDAPRHVVEYLMRREGWRNEVYIDTLGNPTAGMGHLLDATERAAYPPGHRVPPAVLAAWTRADSGAAYAAALRQAGELGLEGDKSFVTVLASVNFQLGTHWRTKFPKTWEAMRKGRWEAAASMVMGSRWASQTPSRATEFATALKAVASGRRRSKFNPGLTIALVLALVATLAANVLQPDD